MKILDIIMKIWPIITPIMTIIFSTCCCQQQHVNMQIRYSIDTLCLMGKPISLLKRHLKTHLFSHHLTSS